MRVLTLLLVVMLGVQSLLLAPAPVRAQTAELNVQRFLERQPGPLKSYRVGERSAAQVIAAYSGYYNLDARIILTLLELVPRLLSTPNPAAERLEQPFGGAGPRGFQAQIEWAVRELRAGFGPYDAPPLLHFSDGTTVTLDLRAEPSLIAVQRFLALGRTQPEWRSLTAAYVPLYRQLWGDQPQLPTPTPAATRPFLLQPWPMGIDVIHASYFDHVYPTVDRGPDDNTFVVDYLGRGNRSYNTHDGHDYYFPAQPIGTPILAAAPGMAYAYTARGNGVVIRHGGALAGYETVYWHLDQFATIFAGTIDSGVGVPVAAGTVLGTSGKSGFTDGGAHLHFEVRHNGRQVDPYGWYGPGPDPCAAWSAGCAASVWLWHDSLRGTYDFTPPDAPAPPDREAPQGSLAISPDQHLGLLAHFDGSLVATFGQGFPQFNGSAPQFDAGVFGQALRLSPGLELTYPISGNLDLDQGTLALWVRLPAAYPPNSTGRHYLFAASAHPEAGPFYTDTLALRREQHATGALWNFWSVDHNGVAHSLTVSDTLLPERWYHLAVTWDRATGSKALFIDGQRVAAAEGIDLPLALGEQLRLGAFVAHFGALDAAVDHLAIWRRVLDARELQRLAARRDIYSQRSGPLASAAVVTDRSVVLDANALDAQGGIVAVQLRRDDEPWSAPMPYYDAFRWTITGTVGLHTFAIRYRDRADNETVVTTTVELAPPLQGAAELRTMQEQTALLALHVEGLEQMPPAWLPADELASTALQMQIGPDPELRDAAWEPFAPLRMWRWDSAGPQPLYVRFRDERGRLSPIYRVMPEAR